MDFQKDTHSHSLIDRYDVTMRRTLQNTAICPPFTARQFAVGDGLPPGEILFPHADKTSARIRYFTRSARILDWENNQWVCYEYEGVTWHKEEFEAIEYEILYRVLASQIRRLFLIPNPSGRLRGSDLVNSCETVNTRRILTLTPVLVYPLPGGLPLRDVESFAVQLSDEPDVEARIVYTNNQDILVWEGNEWLHYSMTPTGWALGELRKVDYEILYGLLAPVIRMLFAEDTKKFASVPTNIIG